MDVGTRIYSKTHDKCITYVRKAYNGKDYEFTDDKDNLIILNQKEFDELSAKADGKVKTVILVYKLYGNIEEGYYQRVHTKDFLGVAKDFDIANKMIDKERINIEKRGYKLVKDAEYTYEDRIGYRIWFYFNEEIVIEDM